MTQALVKRVTVEEVVAAYQSAAETVVRCYAELASAEKNYSAALQSRHRHYHAFQGTSRAINNFEADVPFVLANLRKDTWRVLFEKLEVERFLSSARARELELQIENDELPPLTVESVMSLFTGLCAQLPQLSEESVWEAFELLRPRERNRTAKLKTNNGIEVRRKVILGSIVEANYRGMLRVSYYGEGQLRTVERVLRMLAGQGARTEQYYTAIHDAMEAGNMSGETEFFRYRACKNGNLHLEFKRLDLLAKLNQIAGGKNLRPHEAREAS